MATRVTRDYVCDICESDNQVQRWRVVKMGKGKQVSVDLCHDHAQPFEQTMALFPNGKRSQVRKREVKTPAQIKALRNAKAAASN